MIGRNGERRSRISAQAARHDDDDEMVSLNFEQFSLAYFVYTFFWFTIS